MLKEALEMIYKKQMLKILIVVIGTAVAALGMDMAIYAGFGSCCVVARDSAEHKYNYWTSFFNHCGSNGVILLVL